MILNFYKSTIGKKVVVAITGFLLFGFVFSHMAGNLKVFGGFDSSGIHKIDHYAEFLEHIAYDLVGEYSFLWMARAGLLLCLILHVVTVVQLKLRNNASRKTAYARKKSLSSSLSSKLMTIGGIVILTFVIIHILHLTTGDLHNYGFVHGHVYANIYSAFKVPYIAIFYIFCMFFVGFHLSHGLWSMFQTLGLDSPGRNKCIRLFATLSAVIVVIGFISVPLAVMGGFLPEPSDNFLEGH